MVSQPHPRGARIPSCARTARLSEVRAASRFVSEGTRKMDRRRTIPPLRGAAYHARRIATSECTARTDRRDGEPRDRDTRCSVRRPSNGGSIDAGRALPGATLGRASLPRRRHVGVRPARSRASESARRRPRGRARSWPRATRHHSAARRSSRSEPLTARVAPTGLLTSNPSRRCACAPDAPTDSGFLPPRPRRHQQIRKRLSRGPASPSARRARRRAYLPLIASARPR